MPAVVYCYVVYVLISVALTIWVARTLHKNGRVFLVEAFHGNTEMADSVNHLLVVGFYLINIGYVSLALKYGDRPHDLQESFEYLGTKIGLVLVVLGIMHFFNLFNFDKLRHKGRKSAEAKNLASAVAGPMQPLNQTIAALRTVREGEADPMV